MLGIFGEIDRRHTNGWGDQGCENLVCFLYHLPWNIRRGTSQGLHAIETWLRGHIVLVIALALLGVVGYTSKNFPAVTGWVTPGIAALVVLVVGAVIGFAIGYYARGTDNKKELTAERERHAQERGFLQSQIYNLEAIFNGFLGNQEQLNKLLRFLAANELQPLQKRAIELQTKIKEREKPDRDDHVGLLSNVGLAFEHDQVQAKIRQLQQLYRLVREEAKKRGLIVPDHYSIFFENEVPAANPAA